MMANKEFLPSLTPHISEWMLHLAQDKATIKQLLREHGSPLHVHHLSSFDDNVADFRKVIQDHRVAGFIQYARKVNRSTEYVARAIELGIGIDVSSAFELEQTLEMGCAPEKLIYTAAGKRDQDIALCIEEGIVLVLDQEEEVARVRKLASDRGKSAKIAFRLCGFEFNGTTSYSRFGISLKHFPVKLAGLVDPAEKELSLIGLHFHLNGYSIEERAQAAHVCCDLIEKLRSLGFPLQFLDIGGV